MFLPIYSLNKQILQKRKTIFVSIFESIFASILTYKTTLIRKFDKKKKKIDLQRTYRTATNKQDRRKTQTKKKKKTQCSIYLIIHFQKNPPSYNLPKTKILKLANKKKNWFCLFSCTATKYANNKSSAALPSSSAALKNWVHLPRYQVR